MTFPSRPILIGLLAAMIAPEAQAQDTEGLPPRALGPLADGGVVWPPYLVGSLSADVYLDHIFAADDPDDELTDAFIEAKLAANVFFTRNLYLETGFALDPVQDPRPGTDRFFEDNALKLGALSLTYEDGPFWVSGGKGTVNFGIARNVGPGIYGADIANDSYSVRGRVGFSGNYAFDAGALGAAALYGAVFTLDTSFLATPLFNDADGPSRSLGGAGNTSGLNNFGLAVDGSGIDALPGFRYHAAVIRQSTDFVLGPDGTRLPDSAASDETRFVLAGEATLNSGAFSFTPVVEYAHLDNARGYDGRTERYLTGGVDIAYDRWSLAVAATGWTVDRRGGSSADNLQGQLSVAYLFENGVTVQAGYRYLDEFSEESHTAGLALSYDIPFAW